MYVGLYSMFLISLAIMHDYFLSSTILLSCRRQVEHFHEMGDHIAHELILAILQMFGLNQEAFELLKTKLGVTCNGFQGYTILRLQKFKKSSELPALDGKEYGE